MTNHLIIFAKNPELGSTKTRIGTKLGDDVALAIYYSLIHRAQRVTANIKARKIVYYSSFVDREDSWDNNTFEKRRQVKKELGVRMATAINESFNENAKKVVLIGTDIYDLTPQIINDAFDQLSNHDVVIGPAKDGGYYLIGLSQPADSLFKLSAWSHSEVFNQTKELIGRAGLTFSLLPELNDIDEPDDLKGTNLEQFLIEK
ncbi:MAG: TIGR04282 family arsenosugar biosynthesis glycosyltransferase [Fulvivirga sp.]|uniref:TIGR04282 family arsenosugar biosynthesis glycosyltransferase n=1 Tax=Fulvivirga sp. TaxID=1931237 RepID=UPI0032EB91C3